MPSALQARHGGRFGEHLVASGTISQETLDAFIHKTPVEPENLRAPPGSTRRSFSACSSTDLQLAH